MTDHRATPEANQKQQIKQWEKFRSDATTRGVYLIYEKLYIFPGEIIPDNFGPELTPHYRLLNRTERRLKKRGNIPC